MKQLSPRQQAIIDFIKSEVRAKGYPPSVREIGAAVGLASSSTVHGHLERLEKRGYIRRDPTKPRAIEVLDGDHKDNSDPFHQSVRKVPLIGKVTAGEPILATENVEDYYPVPAHLAGDYTVFMLEVKGDSMIQAGILNGDYVIIRQQSHAQNGDIVVAMTDQNEATVKRFYQENKRIRLQPENDALQPIYLNSVAILGKVIGLYREF